MSYSFSLVYLIIILEHYIYLFSQFLSKLLLIFLELLNFFSTLILSCEIDALIYFGSLIFEKLILP